ncbi:MAG: electron transfer flavoprotein subunit alpha/FixB family protein [Haloarculaceae archaeon]
MVDIDPTDLDIAELGPKIKDVDDLAELEQILAKEKEGEHRDAVETLVEDRIEKVRAEGGGIDPDHVDLTDLTIAELANMVRDIEDLSALEDMLEREAEGKDRKGAKRQLENRIESLQEDIEGEGEAVEYVPPEEKYPDLSHPTADKQYIEGTVDGHYEDIWVYCETQQGEFLDVSREMLGKARELMDQYEEDYGDHEDVVAVVIGSDVEALAEEAIAYGADKVVYHDDERLDRFRHKPYTEIFCHACRDWDVDWRDYHEPRYTVFPATNNGRDLSALVQGELDSGLASDCSDLYIENVNISNPAKTGKPGETVTFEKVLHMPRPDFSGFEYSTILCIDKPHRDFHPQGASVIPGTFDLPEPDHDREGELIEHDIDLPEDWFQIEVTEYDQLEEGVDLTGYDVVVALGRGIGDQPTEGIELGLDMVDAFEDAELGLSRGVITASYQFDSHVEQYVTLERQVGESGQVVEPDVYIAAGISGAVQHKVGMDESDTIVAINSDPDADIKDYSDYFIPGDLFDVLPRLTEALESGDFATALQEASDD